MNSSFKLTLNRDDGPVVRQLGIGLAGGLAGYLAIGVVFGVIMRVFVGEDAWRGFDSQVNVLWALAAWSVGWPLFLILAIAGGRG